MVPLYQALDKRTVHQNAPIVLVSCHFNAFMLCDQLGNFYDRNIIECNRGINWWQQCLFERTPDRPGKGPPEDWSTCYGCWRIYSQMYQSRYAKAWIVVTASDTHIFGPIKGTYEPLQCHGSTGFCWCVTENGTEISGTRSAPGKTRAVCRRDGNILLNWYGLFFVALSRYFRNRTQWRRRPVFTNVHRVFNTLQIYGGKFRWKSTTRNIRSELYRVRLAGSAG